MRNNVIELKGYVFKSDDLYDKHSATLDKIYWRVRQYKESQARKLEQKMKRNKNKAI